MLDVIFDARENLKDSEYKNLSEMCGDLRKTPDSQCFLTRKIANRLKELVFESLHQEEKLRNMQKQMDTYRENLFRALEENEHLKFQRDAARFDLEEAKVVPASPPTKFVCSCGNTYKSKAGLKRHRKKTKCPTAAKAGVCICVDPDAIDGDCIC